MIGFSYPISFSSKISVDRDSRFVKIAIKVIVGIGLLNSMNSY